MAAAGFFFLGFDISTTGWAAGIGVSGAGCCTETGGWLTGTRGGTAAAGAGGVTGAVAAPCAAPQ